MIRMAIEFVGGPLDGHYQQVVFGHDSETPSQQHEHEYSRGFEHEHEHEAVGECQRTVMAIIGKNKKLADGQRVAIYRLADRAGRWQYHFQGEMLYSPG